MSGCPTNSTTTAAVIAAAPISAGASHRLQPSSGVESIRGSSWYSIRPASYQLFIALPDAHSPGGIEIEFLPRLHAERLVPRVHVAHDVGALLGRGVRVGEQAPPQIRFAIVAAPDLRPTEIE